MNSINLPQFSRNYGFWNEQEQQAIINARVAIAGVGGDGFQLGLKLAMMGVQTFDVADPEVFEPENTNRVLGAAQSAYGRSKAEVFKERVLEINPKADIRIFRQGVTKDNVKEFMGRATLVLDESELTRLDVGTLVAREARRLGIPNILVMNVGFAAQITTFHPNGKYTFERFMGIPKNTALNDIKKRKVKFAYCLPYLPTYGDLRTLKAVEDGAPLPSIAQGVDIASAVGASQVFLHIVKGLNNHRPEPVWAPKVAYIDAYKVKAGVVRLRRLSHYYRLCVVALKNLLRLSPRASFTDVDRAHREPS